MSTNTIDKRVRAVFRSFLVLFSMAGFMTAVYLYIMGKSADDGRVVIQGAGNSGNTIHVDTIIEELASQLTQQSEFAPISPDELAQIGAAVRQRALDGDPTAALVMLRAAQVQVNNKG